MPGKDPKAVAALIMGKMPPSAPGMGPDAPKSADGEDGPDMGMDAEKAQKAAAEDVMSAIKNGDTALFLTSLKDILHMLDNDEPDVEPNEEP
jgi:hypothetical protein